MKSLIVWICALMLLGGASAQKRIIQDPHAQVRSVTGFHAIEVSSAVDLYLSQGEEEALAVSASDASDLEHMETIVESGVLKIRIVHTGGIRFNIGNKHFKAYVSFKSLDRLSASGSSDVYVDGAITGGALEIHLSGSSDFKGAVKVQDLTMHQSGSSDASITGEATNIHIELSGASDLKGYGLVVENCTARASGSSDIRLTVNKELNAQVSGSSDFYYKGTAVIKDLHSSGSSSVSRKD